MDKLDTSKGYFGVFLQYPGLSGNINDIEPVIKNCKEKEIKVQGQRPRRRTTKMSDIMIR